MLDLQGFVAALQRITQAVFTGSVRRRYLVPVNVSLSDVRRCGTGMGRQLSER